MTMEDQEDDVGESNRGDVEMGSKSGSSWGVIDGNLEDTVKVVEDSEDAIYTAGLTSKLVLAPFSSSTLEESSPPCELTVTFQERLGHVQQIYVLSTARICEIYGQKEHDADMEYICTVRGGIISLDEEDEFPGDANADLPSASEFTNAEDVQKSSSLMPSAVPEGNENAGHQASVQSGKEDQLATAGESGSLTSQGSEEDLFRSFTDPISEKNGDGTASFEESLDQADWVECPHSPMKSFTNSTSDDEVEVENNKSGFYFIDAYGETQFTEHQQVKLFTDAIANHVKNGPSASFHCDIKDSSVDGSWKEGNEEEPSCQAVAADPSSPPDSTIEPNSIEAQEVKETREFSAAHENLLPKEDSFQTVESAVEIYGDDEKKSSAGSKDDQSERSTLESCVQKAGDIHDKLTIEPPVYECEVNLVDADAWKSLTIRLLSMKNRAQVEIHRVVVTYIPGPPVQPPHDSSKGPFQESSGPSSLLAMLIPGIVQMARARRLPEPRKVNNLVDNAKAEFKGKSSETKNSEPQVLETAREIATSQPVMNPENYSPAVEVGENPKVIAEDSIVLGHLGVGKPDGPLIADSSSQGDAVGGEKASSGVISKEFEIGASKHAKLMGDDRERLDEAHQKQDDNGSEIFQRLDRLENICLRMESSLNSALENMDKRLKLLESGGSGRMPALGHTIWGPAFDSGSFVSTSSAHQSTAQTVAEAGSLMDSQIAFPITSPINTSLGEASGNKASSVPPFYPGLHSLTSPSLVSSISSALPLWPLSWPQHVSPDSSSQLSGLSSSFMNKNGQLEQLGGSVHGSDHPSNGGETYWESRSSDDSETDLSSDSEQTLSVVYCENSRCQCCPEPVLLTPVKPIPLVDNALASALSAFSASFKAKNVDSSIEGRVGDDEEVTDDEDSFTSEEQVPLVEVESFPCIGEKEDIAEGDPDNVFLHDYQAIPLSSNEVTLDHAIEMGIPDDIFWTAQKGENNPKWQDEVLQTQEENIFHALEDFVRKSEAQDSLDATPTVVIQAFHDHVDSVHPISFPDVFQADSGINLQKTSVREAVSKSYSEAVFDANGEDLQQNPFLQDLESKTDKSVGDSQISWLQESWSEKVPKPEQNVAPSYLTVRGFSRPKSSQPEAFLQEDFFPEEWNWFASEFSPISSVVEVKDSFDGAPTQVPIGTLLEMETLQEYSSLEIADSKIEPWSLLDAEADTDADDSTTTFTVQRFDKDFYEKDVSGQNGQWSLLDDYPPPPLCVNTNLEEDCPDDRLEQNQPRSLLDEDISILPGKLSATELKVDFNPVPKSLEEFLRNAGVVRADMSHSPSSQTSKSNPFEDEYEDRLDLIQGTKTARHLLLESQDFCEDVQEFETSEPERSQSLLFHLSL